MRDIGSKRSDPLRACPKFYNIFVILLFSLLCYTLSNVNVSEKNIPLFGETKNILIIQTTNVKYLMWLPVPLRLVELFNLL